MKLRLYKSREKKARPTLRRHFAFFFYTTLHYRTVVSTGPTAPPAGTVPTLKGDGACCEGFARGALLRCPKGFPDRTTLLRPSPSIDLTVTKSAAHSFRCTPSNACTKRHASFCAKRGVQANRTEERSAPRACRHAEVLSALAALATPSVDFSAAARCESRDSSGSDEQSILESAAMMLLSSL